LLPPLGREGEVGLEDNLAPVEPAGDEVAKEEEVGVTVERVEEDLLSREDRVLGVPSLSLELSSE